MIDAVIVEDPVAYPFPGSISRDHVRAGWTWACRDLCTDLISQEALDQGLLTAADIEPLLPEIMARMRGALSHADKDPEASRRLRAMLGSEEAREALPTLMNALRARPLLGKAQAFGKAVNTITDDAALGAALHSMPLQDPPLAALLLHAAVGQVANPTRLITTTIRLCGANTEVAVARSGFTPLVEAILAHAQNQLYLMQPAGAFADIDLICRGMERFHRLVRSLTGNIEFARGSRWSTVLSAITKQVSGRMEPRLRDIVPDMNQALRRGREGSIDRLDDDRLLAALNGIYLLSTIRDCRDSLALNALFDAAWSQSGQALELHLQRNLDLLRENPSDAIVGTRLEVGIKMAEVRFNAEYAETLRRARASAERRI